MMNNDEGTQSRSESEQAPDARADEIVAEIDETRGAMSETVEAIGEKLDPGNLAREAGETARAATVGKVELMATGAQETWRDVSRNPSSIIDTITSNPIPAGMVAAGLAMLFMNRGASASSDGSRSMGGSAYANNRYGTPDYGSPRGSWNEGSSGSMKDKAGSKAGELADQASRQVDRVAGDLGQSAADAQDEAQRMMRQGSSQFRRLLDESPLAVGAVALAAGAAAGMLLPVTEPERRTIGEARDRVVGEAESMAHEQLDKAEQQMSDQQG